MEQAAMPAEWVHAIPGRLRVKVAVIKKDPAAAAAAERWLRQEPDILDAVASPVTGSILIHYDPQRTSPQTILALMARRGLSARVPQPDSLSLLSHELGKTLGMELLKLALAEMFSCGPMELLLALI